MRSGKNILKLSLALALSVILNGCATGGGVTNAEACIEIPFLDGPEGACGWTVTHETELINAAKWKEIRPLMIMVPVDSWTEIRKDWLKGCRLLGPDCVAKVDSVDRLIKSLSSLAGSVMKQP